MKLLNNNKLFIWSILLIVIALTSVTVGWRYFDNNEYQIKMETVSEYVDDSDTFTADIVIPQVSGMSDQEEEDAINTKLEQTGNDLIAQYKSDLQDVLETYGKGEGPHFASLFSYDLVAESDNAISYSTTITHISASAGLDTEFFVFDKDTGTRVTLNDIFDHNPNYMANLKAYLLEEIEIRRTKEDTPFWEGSELDTGFENIEARNRYYLDQDGNLVIYFEKYDIAPGAWGPIMFTIPEEVFDKINGDD